jgi:hypothetical protein
MRRRAEAGDRHVPRRRGLADTMLYCRDKIYPLGLPNGISHVITAIAVLFQLLGSVAASCRRAPKPIEVKVRRHGTLRGRFWLLAVTTLEKLLLGSEVRTARKDRSSCLRSSIAPARCCAG